jgi:hypothetical protein
MSACFGKAGVNDPQHRMRQSVSSRKRDLRTSALLLTTSRSTLCSLHVAPVPLHFILNPQPVEHEASAELRRFARSCAIVRRILTKPGSATWFFHKLQNDVKRHRCDMQAAQPTNLEISEAVRDAKPAKPEQ